jgi:hypothetical protein
MNVKKCFYCTKPVTDYYFIVSLNDIKDSLCLKCYAFLRLGGIGMEKDYPEHNPNEPKVVQKRFRYFKKKDTNEK